MKNIALLFVFVSLTIAGCKKSYQGDTYDFSASKASYVEFSAASKKPIITTQGGTITAVVQMRTALTEDAAITYAITGTSAKIGGTIIILRNTLKTTGSIILPSGIVPVGSSVEAQLKLVSAMKGSDILRVGFNGESTEIISVTINP